MDRHIREEFEELETLSRIVNSTALMVYEAITNGHSDAIDYEYTLYDLQNRTSDLTKKISRLYDCEHKLSAAE